MFSQWLRAFYGLHEMLRVHFVGGGTLYDRKENSVFRQDPYGQQAFLAEG